MTEPIVRIELWTPEMAKNALKGNTINRKLSKRDVDRYIKDMKQGRWTLNGESVKLDHTGRLLDGQHRMHALIGSGTSQKIVTVRNLPSEDSTFATIDCGRKRTSGSVLQLSKVKNSNAVAAAIAFFRFLLTGEDKLTSQEVVEVYKNHSELFDEGVRLGNAVKNLVRTPVYASFLAEAMSTDGGKAIQFHEQFATGVGLDSDSAILALRNYFINQTYRKAASNSALRLAQYNACRLAFQYWKNGKKRKLIQNNYNRPKVEEFVSIDFINKMWSALLDKVSVENPFLHSYLIEGAAVGRQGKNLVVRYCPSKTDQMEMVDNPKNHMSIEACLDQLGYTGWKIKLMIL